MTASSDIAPRRHAPLAALILTVLLLAVEFAVIGVTFKHGIAFTCLDNWSPRACATASFSLVGLYCAAGVLALYFTLRPAILRDLIAEAGRTLVPLLANAAGVVLALVPVLFLTEGSGDRWIGPSFLFWIVGMTLMLGGAGLVLAPPARWRAFLSGSAGALAPMLAVAMLTPWMSRSLAPIWNLEPIRDHTFTAVVWLVGVFGYQVDADPLTKIIGSETFKVAVAPACSGIEGIALVTVFVTIYLALFRKEMRFPHALLLYPVGIATSALFNVLRIAVLLAIGLEGNPELAAGGFHSHAGWLLFTLIALGIIAVAQSVPALRRAPARSTPAPAVPGFWSDPVVARILPFAVFMLTALFASALANTPGAVYPLRAALIAAVLLPFLPVYRRLAWRLDPLALLAGGVIGLVWVLIPVASTDAPPYGELAGTALFLWFVARGIGTVLLIPLVEELFFRDYLESRLRLRRGALWSVAAAIVTAALFAALHDRWAEAFAAGLVFSALARRGTVADAILAHAVANAVVFGVAVATGNLAII